MFDLIHVPISSKGAIDGGVMLNMEPRNAIEPAINSIPDGALD